MHFMLVIASAHDLLSCLFPYQHACAKHMAGACRLHLVLLQTILAACYCCLTVFAHSLTAKVHDWQLQIPAGVVADRFGGVHVLLAGLACWSTMTGLNPLAGYTTHPLQTLIVMRAALGLAQSVMMPSVSATAAR